MFKNDPLLSPSLLGIYAEPGPDRKWFKLKIYGRLPYRPFEWAGLALPEATTLTKQFESGDYTREWRRALRLVFGRTLPGHVFAYWVRSNQTGHPSAAKEEAYPFQTSDPFYGRGTLSSHHREEYIFSPQVEASGSAASMTDTCDYFAEAVARLHERIGDEYGVLEKSSALLVVHVGVGIKERQEKDLFEVLLQLHQKSGVSLPAVSVIAIGNASRLMPFRHLVDSPELQAAEGDLPFIVAQPVGAQGLAVAVQDAVHRLYPAQEVFTIHNHLGHVLGTSQSALTEVTLPQNFGPITLKFSSSGEFTYQREGLLDGITRYNFWESPNQLADFEVPLLSHQYGV
jgi:hypothetical protein